MPPESPSVSSEFVEAACPGAPLQSGLLLFDASSPSPSKTQGCSLLFLLELMGFELLLRRLLSLPLICYKDKAKAVS